MRKHTDLLIVLAAVAVMAVMFVCALTGVISPAN